MNRLVRKIEKWSEEKGLNEADPRAQFLKVVEEVGEVAAAMARNNRPELIDGIGDVVVTLIILAQQYDLDLETPMLHGSGKRHLKKYAASTYRRSLDDSAEEEEVEDDEEDEGEEEEVFAENEFELTEILNVDDIDKDIKMAYDETIYKELDKIGNQIFVNATIDFGITKNPFYEDIRNYPVFYSSLSDVRQIIKINIPELEHHSGIYISIKSSKI